MIFKDMHLKYERLETGLYYKYGANEILYSRYKNDIFLNNLKKFLKSNT